MTDSFKTVSTLPELGKVLEAGDRCVGYTGNAPEFSVKGHIKRLLGEHAIAICETRKGSSLMVIEIME